MSQAQATVLTAAIEDAAFQAVYTHQYNTPKAVAYIRSEVPAATYDMAIATINRIVRKAVKS